MPSKRPAAVAWIVALTRVRLAMSLIAVGAALFFLSPFESETLESFRRGWVGASGRTVEEYGPEQAGEVAGAASVPLILSILILTFVRRRKTRALQVAALVNLILSWAQPITWPITITTVVLANRKSTKDYFAGETKSPLPSRRPVAPRPRAITLP